MRSLAVPKWSETYVVCPSGDFRPRFFALYHKNQIWDHEDIYTIHLVKNYIYDSYDRKLLVIKYIFEPPFPGKDQSSIMSDYFRRASDAFYHRKRRDSADSTEATKSPDTVKSLEQEQLTHNPEPVQPNAHASETFAGVATSAISLSSDICVIYTNKVI